MTTSAELALVDTNVLVESLYKDSAHHGAAAALLDRAQAGDISLCVLPQVLGEFYSVVTHPKRVSAPMSAEEAIAAINVFRAMPGISVLPVPPDVVARWLDLAMRHPVTRGGIFDVMLIAAALGNGVHRVYTYNRPDFERFEELEVLEP